MRPQILWLGADHGGAVQSRAPPVIWSGQAVGAALIFSELLLEHHGLAANHVFRVVNRMAAKVPIVVADTPGRATL
jgi:hypothetical protein